MIQKTLLLTYGSMLLMTLNGCGGAIASGGTASGGTASGGNAQSIEAPWTLTITEPSPNPSGPDERARVFAIREGISDSLWSDENGQWNRLEPGSTETMATLVGAIEWTHQAATGTERTVGGVATIIRLDHQGNAIELRREVLPERLLAARQEAVRLVMEARSRMAAAAQVGPAPRPANLVMGPEEPPQHCINVTQSELLFSLEQTFICANGTWLQHDYETERVIGSGTVEPALMQAVRDYHDRYDTGSSPDVREQMRASDALMVQIRASIPAPLPVEGH